MAKYIYIENRNTASNNRVLMKAVMQGNKIVGWEKVTKYPPHTVIDEDYVDAKIKEANPDFKGTFNSLTQIQAISDANANDWAYLREQDSAGNDIYSRYRYTKPEGYSDYVWLFEVAIKRDNFTDQEWAAITSGITSGKVLKLDGIDTDRLAEIDDLVGNQTLQSVEHDNDGNYIGVYKTLASEQEQNE